MAVDDWNTNADLNLTVEGFDVAEGSLPKWVNNCIRAMAAAVRVFRNNAYCKDKNVYITTNVAAAPATPAENDLWIGYVP